MGADIDALPPALACGTDAWVVVWVGSRFVADPLNRTVIAATDPFRVVSGIVTCWR
jgi:hypothetical protein